MTNQNTAAARTKKKENNYHHVGPSVLHLEHVLLWA